MIDVLAIKQCDTRDGGQVGAKIENQDDFNMKLGGCTNVTGPVWISDKLQGALNMSGITDFADLRTNLGTPGLTDLFLEDVVFIDSLSLSRVPALKTFAVPKLVKVDTAFIEPDNRLEVNLPALTNVETYFRVKGGISR